jgi:hypothetical protein
LLSLRSLLLASDSIVAAKDWQGTLFFYLNRRRPGERFPKPVMRPLYPHH